MPDILERLKAALADRYRIERELGAGGMATVYLAEDLKHHRKVAVKVLRPELAAAMGSDRFAREIEVAARLQHPHILGVLDSGEARFESHESRVGELEARDSRPATFFYYVMPFVEGETLRDRLARAGELPVPEAVRLLGEIAEALSVAHRAGVVHRDIKPENVLLSGRHAMVMDFGVAKAVTEASGRQQLTTAGVALGTPAYMAPEQASADPQMDGRVDIYALGVLGYEMLTGHTPFPGLNPQQTLSAHMTQAPPPLAQQRSGLSPALEALIMRCLAKRPADRFQTADDLVTALEPLATPSGGMTPTHTAPVSAVGAVRADKTVRAVRMIAVAGGVAVLVAALILWKPWASAGAKPLDDHLVAVLPFRVAGADQSVQYLRQGMVDLLQVKLTGEGGPRAADTRSVLAAVRDAGGTETVDLSEDQVAGVARKLGAGRVLQGSIVGPPDHLVLSGTLIAMPGDKTLAQTSVEGPKDSLFVLVDRLTAQLLALGAGAQSGQLSALTTTNLDALRAYLDGVTAYRRGAFQAATPLLERAVQLDSTFALALSWLVEANGWHQSTGDMGRVRHLAWQYRARLNPQDQLFLTLRLGSRYPRNTPFTDQIADAEKTVQRIPESADAWYYLGDVLFHGGRLSDIANPEARARQAFEAAFQRDSLYGAPITHLASLTFVAGDTAAQRLWTRREIALDSTAEGVPLAQWNLLQATGDGPGIKAFVASLATQGQLSQSLLNLGPLDSVTIAHQVELLDALPRLPTNGADRAGKAFTRLFVLLNRGRPAEAAAAIDTLRAMGVPHTNAVSVFVAFLQGGQLPDTLAFGGDRPSLDLFHFVQGDLSVIPRLREFFKALAATDTTDGFESRWLPTLDAWIAVKRGDTTANRLVDVADSLWQGRRENSQFGAGVLARLYQSQGRLDRALRAVRRRYITLGEPEPIGLAESFRLEGELAAKTGDKVGAIRAYRNYLRMRADPEPSRIPQRDSVRAELAAVGDLEGKRQ